MTKSRLMISALIAVLLLITSSQLIAGDDSKKTKLDPEQEYREEFLQWYKQFYPRNSKKLEELRNKDKKLFEESYKLKEHKFADIMETYKKNPDFGQALMDDLKVSEYQNKTLGKIRAEKDKKKKADYIKQLNNIVSKRFDLAVKIKKFKYEELRKRIKRMEKKLADREKEVEELINRKDKEIENRVKELLEDQKEK